MRENQNNLVLPLCFLVESDFVLLCSYGLTNQCSDEIIGDIIEKEKDIKDSVKNLIDISNFNGGKDNITVILIKI